MEVTWNRPVCCTIRVSTVQNPLIKSTYSQKLVSADAIEFVLHLSKQPGLNRHDIFKH